MFSDLSGFTALGERLDPEEVSGLMGRVISMATRVVEAHGGVVNQVVGDEIIALFGIPHAGKDDPVRAVRAALALKREMESLATEVAEDGGPQLALHTSVHSGLILVRPSDGHQGRFSLTGDTMNTAARLLGLAAAGEIVIGRSTCRAVMPYVAAEPLPATVVRGKAEPLAAWRVVQEKIEAPLPAMVGRETEWRVVVSQLDTCIEQGHARFVIIRGEAGIGKSRLLGALTDEARLRGLVVAHGQVPDLGPARGDMAWRQLALSLLGESEPGSALAAMDRAVESGHLAPALRAHLCALADLPMPADVQEVFSQLDVAARERGTLEALASAAGWQAAGRGLVLALEDAHWATAPALALFARLAAACREQPVLFAVTTRPESGDLEKAQRLHAGTTPALTIDLSTLSRAAMAAMAGSFGTADPEVQARCIERSGGNPLFLEQLLLAAGDTGQEALPGSIQALVLARMDRLAPLDRDALQTASVLGQQPDPQALRDLLGDPGYDLTPLVEAKLLRDSGSGIEFAHALIRDGAYEALLKSRRRKLHLRAADWFASRDPGLHAEHLALAGSPGAAAAFLGACEAELARFRFETALTLAQRGAELATETSLRCALAMREGEALRELGHNQEALKAFGRSQALAAGDDELLDALLGVAGAQRIVSDHAGAMAALAAAQPIAERLDDLDRLAQIHYLRGSIAFAGGQHVLCTGEQSKALALAETSGDLLGQAKALSGLADAAYLVSRMSSALGYLGRCLDLADRVGARRFAVTNRAMKGWCLYWCGEAEDALREELAAGAEARALDHRNAMVMTGQSLGFVLRWMGRWTEAADVNGQALALARDVGARRFESIIGVAVAAVLRNAGDRDQARGMAEEAWRKANESGASAFIGPIALLEMAHSAADPVESDRLYAHAEAMLADNVVSHCRVWLHADMIGHRLDQGRHHEVMRHADMLERYVADEPFAWATHAIAAGRALVRFDRSRGSDASSRAELEILLSRSRSMAHGEITERLARALASS
jgi:class 3 adenylate cyclase/tetratricopeptide (TPR) repeat protein